MSHYTDELSHALGREVTEADGLVTIHHELSRRDVILSVAAELAEYPTAPMQVVAPRLAALGIDAAPDSEDFRALAVLVTNLRFGMPPSLRALECLGCAA